MDEFERSFRDADSWLARAHQLIVTADVLIKEFYPAKRQRPTTDEGRMRVVGSMDAALLLLAFAVENALKAVKVARGEVIIKDGKVQRKILGGGPSGHDLVSLADDVQLNATLKEREFLGRLTETIRWAGRYRQPLHSATFEAAQRNNPRTITLPMDVAVIKDVVARCRTLVVAANGA
jgi:hypothetical protein